MVDGTKFGLDFCLDINCLHRKDSLRSVLFMVNKYSGDLFKVCNLQVNFFFKNVKCKKNVNVS